MYVNNLMNTYSFNMFAICVVKSAWNLGFRAIYRQLCHCKRKVSIDEWLGNRTKIFIPLLWGCGFNSHHIQVSQSYLSRVVPILHKFLQCSRHVITIIPKFLKIQFIFITLLSMKTKILISWKYCSKLKVFKMKFELMTVV